MFLYQKKEHRRNTNSERDTVLTTGRRANFLPYTPTVNHKTQETRNQKIREKTPKASAGQRAPMPTREKALVAAIGEYHRRRSGGGSAWSRASGFLRLPLLKRGQFSSRPKPWPAHALLRLSGEYGNLLPDLRC